MHLSEGDSKKDLVGLVSGCHSVLAVEKGCNILSFQMAYGDNGLRA